MENVRNDSEDRERDLKEKTLFGQLAVKKGALGQQQLEEALQIQERKKGEGLAPRKIGEICVEKGFFSKEKCKEILAIQKRLRWRFIIPGYELLEKLGRGSTGEVYRAWQKSLHRLVAVKVLDAVLAKNQSYVAPFIREARSAARLSHENIISGFDVGEAKGIRYFVMEYVDGITVMKLLQRGGALDQERAIRIIYQVTRALEHAHKHGLIHRDIKPDNIMIDSHGVAKLCDLGLAKITNKEGAKAKEERTLGTPNYMSPEQVRGEGDIDIRSDIYSLGATFFHMISGQVPFDGPNPMIIMARHLKDRLPNIREINSAVSPRTCSIVEKMLAKEKHDRYQDPSELLGQLAVLLRTFS